MKAMVYKSLSTVGRFVVDSKYVAQGICPFRWSTIYLRACSFRRSLVQLVLTRVCSFCIKMPFLHRLATLRDDVIFFVYIYQAWAYKVDHTRVNEFGQGGDDEPVVVGPKE